MPNKRTLIRIEDTRNGFPPIGAELVDSSGVWKVLSFEIPIQTKHADPSEADWVLARVERLRDSTDADEGFFCIFWEEEKC